MITFNGIRSDARYVVVEHYPTRKYPKRKYITQTVPGRAGDIYISEGEDAFTNYQEQYVVFLDAKAPGMPQVTRGLADWLLRPIGYKRLEDSYDPDFYRMATPVGGEEFINIFNEYGRGTLTFDCNPKRYFKTGEQSIELARNQVVYAPTNFRASPLYTVNCSSGTGNIIIVVTDANENESRFQINDLPGGGYVVIDPEAHTARHYVGGSSTNVNPKVQNDYENLKTDRASKIRWNEGYVTSVSIVPRWWTI